MTLSCIRKRNRRSMNSSNSCCNRNPSARFDGRFTSFFLASTVILCYSLSLTMTMTMTRVDAFIPIPTIPRTTTAITKDLMQSRHWDATVTAVSTSLSLSSSLNDDDHEYFFTAPDLTAEETIDHTKTKTKKTTHTTDTKIDLATIASREQNELESMIVNDKEHTQQQEPQREEEEGGQTVTTAMATTSTRNVDAVPITTVTKAAATTTTPAPSSVSNSIPNSMSISMDVDGNGTGGLMKRSHTGGGTGTDATLMVTSMKTLAFPIDSGKDGMEANDTKRRTRTRTTETTTQTTNTASDGTGTGTGMRLVRYTSNNSNSNSNGPSSKSISLVASAATMPKTTTTKKLVLAPAGTTTRRGTTGTGTHHGTTGGGGSGSAIVTKAKGKNTVTNGIVTNSNSRLVRYNGPDLDDTTDYDGMETVSTRNQRQQEIQLSDSKLVMYNPTTPTTPDNKYNKSNNNIDPTNNNNDNNNKKKKYEKQQKQKQKHHRPTLTQDIKYSIQYIEKTDFTMARKTGLAVNKPISLWIERDTFL